MQTTMTKTCFAILMLLSGVFSFSAADAQFICTCIPGQPSGYCYVDIHGNNKCQKFHIGHGGTWRIGENGSGMGIKTSLQVNPNPVINSTTISFSLEQSQIISLGIYDMNGKLVSTLANASFEEGGYEMEWNAADVNAGFYFLQLHSEENSEMIKLVVTK